MKENSKIEENLIGKLCDFRGHLVLVIKKFNLTFDIYDNLKVPKRYEVMFKDGSIDVVSVNSLKLIR